MADSHHHSLSRFTLAGALITLGIVFGDIGTSPLYVLRAIIGNAVVSKELVYGGMSCVFWTLILVTTLKYVVLALNADNKGEGGIFALYALLRRYRSKWVIYPALVGCATLIADGFLTPAISISSAIEGLTILYPKLQTVPIVISVLILLFVFQQVGTKVVGGTFGPVMLVWFSMLAILGIRQIVLHPEVLSALNPYWAYNLLFHYPKGFWLLGAVFLCTTGGEAMYSDLGHCGKWNIRVSWGFVLVCLLINYFGQSSYLLTQFDGQKFTSSSVFYALMPSWFLPYGIAIATMATIIASQALISGVFTLVNEAMKLRLWINHKVSYPTDVKGQIYIPAINWFLMLGCILVVLIFKKAENMEGAYGLTIIIDMLMTTILLIHYLRMKRTPEWISWTLALLFATVEVTFLVANAAKIFHGGWFSLLVAGVLFSQLLAFYQARKIRQRHNEFVLLDDYIPMLTDLQNDEQVPKEATNLVFMTNSNSRRYIDSNIIYSIFKKRPKRADVYWFVHVDILDEPYGAKYSVDTIVPQKVFFVRLQFGFKVDHKVNRMLRIIVEDMIKKGEVDGLSRYPSLRKWNQLADFKFFLMRTRISVDNEIGGFNRWAIRTYRFLKKLALPTREDFGLEITNVEEETVPINVAPAVNIKLQREQ